MLKIRYENLELVGYKSHGKVRQQLPLKTLQELWKDYDHCNRGVDRRGRSARRAALALFGNMKFFRETTTGMLAHGLQHLANTQNPSKID